MQEYTDYLESMYHLRLTAAQKDILAEDHLEHITSKYVSVIITSMTEPHSLNLNKTIIIYKLATVSLNALL
jgi:hypothetical protein